MGGRLRSEWWPLSVGIPGRNPSEYALAELNPLEFIVIPKGVAHRVVPDGHVKLLLFEPATTEHTGKVRSEITKDKLDRLI